MQNKTILEFCLSPDLGGLELFMIRCIEHFSTDTNLFIAVAPHQKIHKTLTDKNLFLVKRNKLFPILPAIKLARYIDEKKIDTVHFHWTKDIATVVLAKLLSKQKPKIIQSRHMRMTRFKDDFYHKWLYKHIDMMHAVTHHVKKQLETFIPPEIRPMIKVIHPGTHVPSIDKEKKQHLIKHYALKDDFIVGMVGRIEEAKGQYLLLEAIAMMQVPDIKILIVGQAMDEAYLDLLKKRIKHLKIEDKVIFTGFTTEVDAHLQLCDITVLATKNETFGLVVIESMANGVPVIANNSGGPLEIIHNGVDGYFFDATAQDLAQKIKMLYKDMTLRKNISNEALHTVKEKFDNNKQLNKLYKVINAG